MILAEGQPYQTIAYECQTHFHRRHPGVAAKLRPFRDTTRATRDPPGKSIRHPTARLGRQGLRRHVRSRRYFEPGFPDLGTNPEDERHHRPERQKRGCNRRDQPARVFAANGGRQSHLPDRPVANGAKQTAAREAGDLPPGLRNGRRRLRPCEIRLREFSNDPRGYPTARAVRRGRRKEVRRQLPAGDGRRTGRAAGKPDHRERHVHDAGERIADIEDPRHPVLGKI